MPNVVKHVYYMPVPLRPIKGKPSCTTFEAGFFHWTGKHHRNVPAEDKAFLYASYMKHLPLNQDPCPYDGASLIEYDDGTKVLMVMVGIKGKASSGTDGGKIVEEKL
jgi:hypothetical protein